MGIHVRTRVKNNGNSSIYLDIAFKNERKTIFLKALEILPETTQYNKAHNKKVLQVVESQKADYLLQLQKNNYDFSIFNPPKSEIITDWMEDFIAEYTKKDLRNIRGVYNKFKLFLKANKCEKLTFSNLTPHFIEKFMSHLEDISTGEGSSSYYKRFKKMIFSAYKDRVLKENILLDVTKKLNGVAKKKETLTKEELKLLSNTPFRNKEITDAFIFCCATGLSWCDIKALEFKDIEIEICKVSYFRLKNQSRTHTKTIVYFPDFIQKLLKERMGKSGKIFDLPSNNNANDNLVQWLELAGIDKKITWHCARHTYGTIVVKDSKNIFLTAKLMGHSSTKHTMRYLSPDENQLIESSKSFQLF